VPPESRKAARAAMVADLPGLLYVSDAMRRDAPAP
jgi:hypothetical protein